jgi:hypothetical protein
MAGRIRNRMDLRRQAELAEQRGPAAPEAAPDTTRGAAARRPRGKRGPARVCARWGVFDASMKQVAVFDYNQRPAAEQKAASLSAARGGTYVVQLVKETMAEGSPTDLD